MVCQVMSTTVPFADLAGVEAAVPPQPARASTAAAATSAAGSLRVSRAWCLSSGPSVAMAVAGVLGLFIATGGSFTVLAVRQGWPGGGGGPGALPDDELGLRPGARGSAARAGSTNGRSRRTHARPSSTKSSRTVVRAGLRNSACGVSSKPTTLTLSGMARPASCMARITPTARSSLPHSTAVTAGSAASTRPAS